MVFAMSRFKGLVYSLMCAAAALLSSCATQSAGTPASVGLEVGNYPAVASTEEAPAIGPQITVGSLTDPCSLGLYDPWWTDHGGQVDFPIEARIR
jgi:hypothetical protein